MQNAENDLKSKGSSSSRSSTWTSVTSQCSPLSELNGLFSGFQGLEGVGASDLTGGNAGAAVNIIGEATAGATAGAAANMNGGILGLYGVGFLLKEYFQKNYCIRRIFTYVKI
jgi:hypothetical protein